jgi:hypothetical protein
MPVKTLFQPIEKTDCAGNVYIGYVFAPADPTQLQGDQK